MFRSLLGITPKCQDLFAQHNIIRLLVGHLAFETVQEHSKYAITAKQPTSIHVIAMASNNNDNSNNSSLKKANENKDEEKSHVQHTLGNRSTKDEEKAS